MANKTLRKGFDIRISGLSAKQTADPVESRIVGLVPPDFRGVKVKLLKKEGDEVKAGTAVYFDKNMPDVKFASPISGRIRTIEYGARRVIQSILIESDGKSESETFKKYSANELLTADGDELKKALLSAGLWPHLRQRPYDRVANPDVTPKSVFVSLMDTAPLAADPEYLTEGKIDEINLSLAVLKKFTEGAVNVVVRKGSSLKPALKNCTVHEFAGPHPAGNSGIHIHHIDPIRRGEAVWIMSVRGLLAWAEFFLGGVYPSKKLVAVAGSAAAERRYFPVTEGCMLKDIPGADVTGDVRIISGNILTGNKRRPEGFLGFRDDLVSIIPEGRERSFLGWIYPGFKSFSFSKTFLSSLFPGRHYDLNTNTNGGKRAFVQTGIFEQVVPMDIYPDFLLKSILAEDIAEMEGLGIYEVSEEDFALCSFIDPSKNDVCGIIRQGLELLEKEG